MKLNGLTNNLKGNDNSLSNSYLSHIVELLRQEVEALSAKETALEEITTEHIETQKVVVDTETVNANTVNTDKLSVSEINEKIILTDIISVFTELKVNGKDVLTVGTFQGPFTYKGIIEVLPETAEAGDVYITEDKVNIFNGNSWDSFTLPVGTVSLAEYNEDRKEMLHTIATVQTGLDSTKEELADFKDTTIHSIVDMNAHLSDIDATLENKVDEAPVNDNAYVRKNGEWIEQSAADNTVKAVVGGSTIENTAEAINIKSEKVNIDGEVKINGSDLPEVNKLSLSKTTKSEDDYSYEIKFGRTPFDSLSSIKQMWVTYYDSYQEQMKSPSQKNQIITKNWHWVKWNSSTDGTAGDNTLTQITAINKNGEIKVIPSFWTDVTEITNLHIYLDTFMAFNPQYCPEGYEDTVYMFVPFAGSTTTSTNKCFLAEMRDGELVRKYDIYNGTGKLKEQGYVPASHIVDYSHYCSIGGGKSLRNKDVNRFCWVAFNKGSSGGSFAIIIGGDKNSKITDPFDPNKAIYVPLPANAYYGYDCMAATDSAWYLQEPATGRMMRITPDGQVSEINLTEAVTSCGFNYIEYMDKNNRPACAYYVHNRASGGKHWVVFLEEDEDGQVNFIERQVTSDAITPTGSNWMAQQFKFMENTNYIFFTADAGLAVDGSTDYGFTAMKCTLWYWDKKSHTTHSIYQLFGSMGNHDWIEMFKTKGNAIWFVPHYQSLAPANRDGLVRYISDVDATDIGEDGIDRGELHPETAWLGTTHGWFSSSETTDGWSYYSHRLQGDPAWASGGNRQIHAATNDDGILLILSYDFMAYALCYGDGNVKVYEITNHDKRSGGWADCDADKIPLLPDEPSTGTSWVWGYSGDVIGLSHGWLMYVNAVGDVDKFDYDAVQRGSWTYFGIQYRNGEPTILAEPRLSKLQRCAVSYAPEMQKWDQYGYNQTYDDYERRKLTLQGIRSYISYCVGGTGNDGWLKEVRHNEKKLLNLEYDGKIISSVEE